MNTRLIPYLQMLALLGLIAVCVTILHRTYTSASSSFPTAEQQIDREAAQIFKTEPTTAAYSPPKVPI